MSETPTPDTLPPQPTLAERLRCSEDVEDGPYRIVHELDVLAAADTLEAHAQAGNPVFMASVAATLKAECEKQHARAEAAESALTEARQAQDGIAKAARAMIDLRTADLEKALTDKEVLESRLAALTAELKYARDTIHYSLSLTASAGLMADAAEVQRYRDQATAIFNTAARAVLSSQAPGPTGVVK